MFESLVNNNILQVQEFVFLEVNPVGQFGWVSKNCNYYLEKKIALKLINLKKKFAMDHKDKLPLYYQDCKILPKNPSNEFLKSINKEKFSLRKVKIYNPVTQSNQSSSSIFYKAVSKIISY